MLCHLLLHFANAYRCTASPLLHTRERLTGFWHSSEPLPTGTIQAERVLVGYTDLCSCNQRKEKQNKNILP